MQIIADLVVIVVALKLAEATGAIEFGGWRGALAATIVCWLCGWLAAYVLTQEFPRLPNHRAIQAPLETLAVALAIHLITAMASVLAALVAVPGARITRFIGLFVASTLIVALSYVTAVLILKG